MASIAARFGLGMETLLWNNSHLQLDRDLLLIGEELTIPTRDGILYTVRLGDTLLDVADIYQTDVEDIAGLTANQVNDPDSVLEGMVLLLPGAVPPPPPPHPPSANIAAIAVIRAAPLNRYVLFILCVWRAITKCLHLPA